MVVLYGWHEAFSYNGVPLISSHVQCDLQEIPRTTDHAPTRTVFTWKIELEAVYTTMAANLMKGMSNLMERVDAELKKRPQVGYIGHYKISLFGTDAFCNFEILVMKSEAPRLPKRND